MTDSADKSQRVVAAAHLITNWRFPKTDYNCTVFRAEFDGASAAYAYLYSDGLEHKYYCYGPALESHDGEYRARFAAWPPPPVDDTAERATLERLEVGDMILHADIFYADEAPTPGFEAAIAESRLAITLFALCWAADGGGMMANHAFPGYRAIIYDEMSASVARSPPPMAGQKMYAATAADIHQVNEIGRQCVWRELYYCGIVRDLVTAAAVGGFPCIIDWFFVQRVHSQLFDNVAMHRKFAGDAAAREIVVRLAAADRFTRTASGVHSSRLFGEVSHDIARAAETTQSLVRLSPYAICAVFEHVGDTVRDSVFRSEYHVMYSTPALWRRMIFEFLYNFYCLNLVGLVHGDPHLNNVTLCQVATATFVTPAGAFSWPAGIGSFVIDFSQSYMFDVERVIRDFGADTAAAFAESQIGRLRSCYTFVRKLPTAATATLGRDSMLAKLVSCTDPQTLMRNMELYYGQHSIVDRGVVELVGRIATRAEQIMHEIGMLMLRDPEAVVEWPNLQLMREFFADELRGGVADAEFDTARVTRSGKVEAGPELGDRDNEAWMFE